MNYVPRLSKLIDPILGQHMLSLWTSNYKPTLTRLHFRKPCSPLTRSCIRLRFNDVRLIVVNFTLSPIRRLSLVYLIGMRCDPSVSDGLNPKLIYACVITCNSCLCSALWCFGSEYLCLRNGHRDRLSVDEIAMLKFGSKLVSLAKTFHQITTNTQDKR
jgi:hypothetical protein